MPAQFALKFSDNEKREKDGKAEDKKKHECTLVRGQLGGKNINYKLNDQFNSRASKEMVVLAECRAAR